MLIYYAHGAVELTDRLRFVIRRHFETTWKDLKEEDAQGIGFGMLCGSILIVGAVRNRSLFGYKQTSVVDIRRYDPNSMEYRKLQTMAVPAWMTHFDIALQVLGLRSRSLTFEVFQSVTGVLHAAIFLFLKHYAQKTPYYSELRASEAILSNTFPGASPTR